MMTMILALAAFLQPSVTAPAQTPNWRLFLGAPGTGAAMYADLGNVRRSGDSANVWLYTVNDAPNPQGIKTSSMQILIDCRAHNSLLIEAHGYAANGTYVDGANYGIAGRSPRATQPGSDDARLEQMVCAAPAARP